MIAMAFELAVAALLGAPGPTPGPAQPATAVFVGSTPCGESMRTLLSISLDAGAELIEWELALTTAADPQTAPTYHLRYRFGPTRANQPGLDKTAEVVERRGTWRSESRRDQRAAAAVVVLDNTLAFLRVGETLLHALGSDGRLMVGNGGWSYTLVQRDAAEPPVDTRLAAADPGDSARTTSRARGRAVFGIFDGRTPCQAIARELGLDPRPGCWKAKWRLTLFHDPKTRQPASYRLEGTLFKRQHRQGVWRIRRGAGTGHAQDVYELTSSDGGSPLLLLAADDRVLFFLDRNQRLLVGNAMNAYTLDRMPAPAGR